MPPAGPVARAILAVYRDHLWLPWPLSPGRGGLGSAGEEWANCAVLNGVPVDQAAACVIARCGLGLSNSVRPRVTQWMPPADGSGLACPLARLDEPQALARALPRRRVAWGGAWLGRTPLPGLARGTAPPGRGLGASAPSLGRSDALASVPPSSTRCGQAGVIRLHRPRAACAATAAASVPAHVPEAGTLRLAATTERPNSCPGLANMRSCGAKGSRSGDLAAWPRRPRCHWKELDSRSPGRLAKPGSMSRARPESRYAR